MRRVLPAPLLSATLMAGWLLLNGSVTVGHVVLGALLAIAIPWWTERRRPEAPRLGAWRALFLLMFIVLYDIVVSAVVVARQILGREADVQSEFVWVPLDIRDPHGIVALASVITLTPGTLSADLSDDRRHLLVHALHVDDPAALVESIKRRYEKPLRAIFDRVDI
jgi:multicomponent K+:H+ antiporter subunit E